MLERIKNFIGYRVETLFMGSVVAFIVVGSLCCPNDSGYINAVTKHSLDHYIKLVIESKVYVDDKELCSDIKEVIKNKIGNEDEVGALKVSITDLTDRVGDIQLDICSKKYENKYKRYIISFVEQDNGKLKVGRFKECTTI